MGNLALLSEESSLLPQRGLCKSREPDGLALEVPLMVREQVNSTPKALPLERAAVRGKPPHRVK